MEGRQMNDNSITATRRLLDKIFAGKLTFRPMNAKRSTSRQMTGLALAEVRPSTTTTGLAIGIDVESGWPIFHDPFTLYGTDDFSSPNIIVFGDLGSGKSYSTKTWVLRNLMIGRRVIIVDKKLQDNGEGEKMGEYSMLATRLGITPITLKIGGGGRRINILDERILGQNGLASQQLLLETVAETAVGRLLSEIERKALRVARKSAHEEACERGETAQVADVTRLLLSPTVDTRALAGIPSTDELARWGRDLGFALERLVSEELSGLIDGPTDPEIDLNSPLTVFDISSLPDEGPAVGIMMSVLNTWVHSQIASSAKPVPTLFVLDEAWHIIDKDFASIARKNAKLARGIGMSNMTVLQHPSDIPPSSPAISMIKEAQTAFIFRQDKTEDALSICHLFGWDESLAACLQALPTGVCMVKIGGGDPLICAWRSSSFEAEICTTDGAMTSKATLRVIHENLKKETENEQ